jgi:integrase
LNLISRKTRPTTFVDAGREAVTLLILATAFRISDVERLLAKAIRGDYAIHLFFREPRKTDHMKQATTHVDVGFFDHNPRICPARAIEHFLRITHGCRLPNSNALFISSLGKNASRQTLQAWVRHQLLAAGIRASAGSARSAASSAAVASGISIDEVMRAAGWKSESVFRKHYLRPVYAPANLYHRYAQRLD